MRLDLSTPEAVERLRRSIAMLSPEVPALRREDALLEVLEVNGPAWCTVPAFDGEPDLMLEVCGQHELEGLVAKRIDSPYRPGTRSRSWVKLKTADWRELHGPEAPGNRPAVTHHCE